jgi:hypothetical protein
MGSARLGRWFSQAAAAIGPADWTAEEQLGWEQEARQVDARSGARIFLTLAVANLLWWPLDGWVLADDPAARAAYAAHRPWATPLLLGLVGLQRLPGLSGRPLFGFGLLGGLTYGWLGWAFGDVGGPGAPWPRGSAGERGGRGWDCSGLVAAAWAGLLLMPWSGPRFWTGSVEALCDAVALGDQRPGDAVLYDGHIVLVLTWPDSAGDSLVLSASNGGRDTNGDDPDATVKVWSSWRYRADAKTALRPKASLASGISEGQREACLSLHALLAGQGLPAGSALAPGRRDELLRQFYGQLDVVQAALGGAA